jgi:hypothetical protein
MSARAASEIAITRSARRAELTPHSRQPSRSRPVIASGWCIGIRSSSVTTVATPGATAGATFASPCTTSSLRRAAIRGSASHWARSASRAFQGGPWVTVTGSPTHSISRPHGVARSAGSSSREANAVICMPGSARSSSGISSRA